MAVAFCWASGLIQIGPKLPAGALPLIRGRKRDVDAAICARSRHGYDGSYLVPGIPEAPDQGEAYEAYVRFRDWLREKPVGSTP